MAVNQQLRRITVAFEGGTASAPRAVFEKIHGDITLVWRPDNSALSQLTGRNRYKYGRRQKSRSLGGTPLRFYFADGQSWTVRVTGDIQNYLSRVLARSENALLIDEVVTPRGTIYAKQFPAEGLLPGI